MADGVKDRLACEMVTLVDFDRDVSFKTAEWADLPDQVLVRNAMDAAFSKADRVLALWLLAAHTDPEVKHYRIEPAVIGCSTRPNAFQPAASGAGILFAGASPSQ
jgi:hypothetical protein